MHSHAGRICMLYGFEANVAAASSVSFHIFHCACIVDTCPGSGPAGAALIAVFRRLQRASHAHELQEMHVVVLARALAVALRGSPQRTAPC